MTTTDRIRQRLAGLGYGAGWDLQGGTMSIWSSVDGEVNALPNHDDEANYHGRGEHTAWVGVATALSWHRLIRLSTGGDDTNLQLLIDSANARRLAARLLEAADAVDAAGPVTGKED